ncbi:hypothetical protein C8J57DRAFT_1529212 [Mycena rebaudengoi]|nr:hypothetical protein C8J57DRAFT_1529212 [Mycena rebaudengoi]
MYLCSTLAPSDARLEGSSAINSFFTASVLWGTLGPKRMFGAGGIYNGLLYCFHIGLILPIPVFMLRKRFNLLEYFLYLLAIIYIFSRAE